MFNPEVCQGPIFVPFPFVAMDFMNFHKKKFFAETKIVRKIGNSYLRKPQSIQNANLGKNIKGSAGEYTRGVYWNKQHLNRAI